MYLSCNYLNTLSHATSQCFEQKYYKKVFCDFFLFLIFTAEKISIESVSFRNIIWRQYVLGNCVLIPAVNFMDAIHFLGVQITLLLMEGKKNMKQM